MKIYVYYIINVKIYVEEIILLGKKNGGGKVAEKRDHMEGNLGFPWRALLKIRKMLYDLFVLFVTV